MLVLSRKVQERVTVKIFDVEFDIVICELLPSGVKLGIDGDSELVKVQRKEKST
jgi:sRNA-binding carbon storage regulator CsrA